MRSVSELSMVFLSRAFRRLLDLHSFPTRRSSDLRRSAQLVRVSVELSDAVTGASLWGEKVEAAPSELFDVQDRIKARSDRKSTRLNSSHSQISYAVFCLKKKTKDNGYLNMTSANY